jgi:hydroxymethylbilane synthase
MLARVDHLDTSVAVACERAFLAELDGSCKTPIAGHATLDGDNLNFRGLLAHPDGQPSIATKIDGLRADAVRLGTEAARVIKRDGDPRLFG